MFALITSAPAVTTNAGFWLLGSQSFWTCLAVHGRDVCAPVLLTTGVSLNWRPPYGEKHADRKHTEACTHTQTHKRRLRKKWRAKSGVGEWSRFRWKRFFWHHRAAEPLLAATVRVRANRADAEALPPDMVGKVWKAREEEEKRIKRWQDNGEWEWQKKPNGVFRQEKHQENESFVPFHPFACIFLHSAFSLSITHTIAHAHKLSHISIILPMSMGVMAMLPGRRRLMLCVSNHITVSPKLMFLARFLLIHMLNSASSTGPPVLNTGLIFKRVLKIFVSFCTVVDSLYH